MDSRVLSVVHVFMAFVLGAWSGAKIEIRGNIIHRRHLVFSLESCCWSAL